MAEPCTNWRSVVRRRLAPPSGAKGWNIIACWSRNVFQIYRVQSKRKRKDSVEHFLIGAATATIQNGNPVWEQQFATNWAVGLGHAIPTLVSAICFDSSFKPYSDIWKRSDSHFRDLASLLTYRISALSSSGDDAQSVEKADFVLSIAATIYPASDRAKALLVRFHDLLRDPSELRDRRILMVHSGSSDDEARGSVCALMVNETIDGPNLEGEDFENSTFDANKNTMNPAERFFLWNWLSNLELETVTSFREAHF